MSTDINKSQKFVKLLHRMQESGGILAEQAMESFGLDERTLRRYLVDLRAIEVPVVDVGRGSERRLSLDPNFGRKGVQLTFSELLSLHFGRKMFDFLQGTSFAVDMDEALERISGWCGGPEHELGSRIDDLERKFMAVPEHAKDHTDDDDIIDEIITALLYQNQVEALYARVGGPVRNKVLHPYTLAHWRQGLYLFALDVETDKVKTYAVDRFRSFSRSRKIKFVYPEEYDPEALVKDCFGIIGGDVHDIVLRFDRTVAPYVRERIWHASQTVQPLMAGEIEVSLRVGISPELESWLLGFHRHVKVLEPVSLRDRVRLLHKMAAEG